MPISAAKTALERRLMAIAWDAFFHKRDSIQHADLLNGVHCKTAMKDRTVISVWDAFQTSERVLGDFFPASL